MGQILCVMWGDGRMGGVSPVTHNLRRNLDQLVLWCGRGSVLDTRRHRQPKQEVGQIGSGGPLKWRELAQKSAECCGGSPCGSRDQST